MPAMVVEHVERTVAFYRNVLGFHVERTVQAKGGLAWALVRRGDVALLFQSRQSLVEALPTLARLPTGAALTLFLTVDGIDALYAQVTGRAEIVQALHETSYGTREFSLRDPNGFVLTFSERIATHRKAA